MDTLIAELHEAVDALTKPVRHAYTQHEVEYAGRVLSERIVRREDAPLLEQLSAAIGSNLGAAGSSGKLARERTPLDISALTMLEEIDERVWAWMLDAGIRPSRRAATGEMLRRWFVAWKVKRKEDAAITAHIQVLNRWAAGIRDLLDPPVKQELTSPCPRCGKMWVTLGKGEETESVRALWAVWRDNPDESYGTCRACGHVWLGVGNMRLLRIAIDDAEKLQDVQ
jgi:hypothetical protein